MKSVFPGRVDRQSVNKIKKTGQRESLFPDRVVTQSVNRIKKTGWRESHFPGRVGTQFVNKLKKTGQRESHFPGRVDTQSINGIKKTGQGSKLRLWVGASVGKNNKAGGKYSQSQGINRTPKVCLTSGCSRIATARFFNLVLPAKLA